MIENKNDKHPFSKIVYLMTPKELGYFWYRYRQNTEDIPEELKGNN